MASLSPLASPSATRAVLEAHGLATKKALGQNFLVNDAVLQKIVALAEVGPSDVVLEVGPGIGTLTIALLKHAAQVVSVERDADLPAVLAETCAPWAEKFSLINKDALALTEEDVREALTLQSPLPSTLSSAACFSECSPADASERGVSHAEAAGCDGAHTGEGACATAAATAAASLPNKLVANLPYAVAATLVLDCFQRFTWLDSATVMVQKEVADRMAAHPGTKDYGAFTIKLSLYAQPAGRFAVGPNNFFPPPRVDSAVLRLDRCTPLDATGAPVAAAIVRAASTMADAAFASRRKTIANSCKTYFAGKGAMGVAALAALPHIFEQAAIDPKVRGEALETADYLRLGKALNDALALSAQ